MADTVWNSNLGLGWWIPMIDNAAHLGGTLMGFALGLCGPKLDELNGRRNESGRSACTISFSGG